MHDARPSNTVRVEATVVSLPPLPRQCGRCRQVFAGDPALDPSLPARWWVCPPCREALFPNDRSQNRRWQ